MYEDEHLESDYEDRTHIPDDEDYDDPWHNYPIDDENDEDD